MMTAIQWLNSSAFDFFISIFVLYHPDRFGLRMSWAAGARSRIPVEQREFLDLAQQFLPVPLTWLYRLNPLPQNAAQALAALAEIPPEEGLAAWMVDGSTPEKVREALAAAARQHGHSEVQRAVLRSGLLKYAAKPSAKAMQLYYEAAAEPGAFAERFRTAMQTYYQVFFSEEEERIQPLLTEALRSAQQQAAGKTVDAVVEELSRGVQVGDLERLQRVAVAASYWTSPLVFYTYPLPDTLLLVFGCRQEGQPLIPGGLVPETLIRTFKALGAPPRLRILRLLSHSPHTPTQLSRVLRLRPPTVVHHLTELRVCGLVHVLIQPGVERLYALRPEGLELVQRGLHDYLTDPFEET